MPVIQEREYLHIIISKATTKLTIICSGNVIKRHRCGSEPSNALMAFKQSIDPLNKTNNELSCPKRGKDTRNLFTLKGELHYGS